MTEITKNKEVLPFDVVAFAVALISAPIVVGMIGIPLIIPFFAVIFGAPLYLIVGTPTLLWMVGRFRPTFASFALAGILSIFALMALMAVADLIRPELGARDAFAYLATGAIFAPLWAGTFALIYRWLNRAARPKSLS